MKDECLEKLERLMRGEVPARIEVESIPDQEERRLAEMLNRLIAFVREIHEFINPLSKGDLGHIRLPSPGNFLGSPFKELHSRLMHLTWQAEQITRGDYSQRVDFMGDFSSAFNAMVVALDNNERMLKTKIEELEKAITHITKLEGLLPICASCKKIRTPGPSPDHAENWVAIEQYISAKTDAQFSHSICPECLLRLYPEFYKK